MTATGFNVIMLYRGIKLGLRPIWFRWDVPFFSHFVQRPVGLANGMTDFPFSDLINHPGIGR